MSFALACRVASLVSLVDHGAVFPARCANRAPATAISPVAIAVSGPPLTGGGAVLSS
jgi:hypothetical protein